MFDEEREYEIDGLITPDAADLQRSYEQQVINVMCDICGGEQTATAKHLAGQGWDIGRGHEICPMHD